MSTPITPEYIALLKANAQRANREYALALKLRKQQRKVQNET